MWRRWAEGRGLDPEPFLRVAHGRRTADTIRLAAPELDPAAEVAALGAIEEVETRGLQPVPGAATLIHGLRRDQWAVVTSGSRQVATLHFRAAGLPGPAVFVTADDVTHGKPDPQGYLLAASRLGVGPSDCVVLEDAPPGVAAGKAAGMRVIAVLTTHPPASLADADARLAALADLRLRPASPGSRGIILEF